MKKYAILIPLFMLLGSTFCRAAIQTNVPKFVCQNQKDSLAGYTGDYQTIRDPQTIIHIYVENGKVTSKDLSNGGIIMLDHLSGDDFIAKTQNLKIRFIRDIYNKVSQISVSGQVMYTRFNGTLPAINTKQPASPGDYAGKYQIIENGQTLVIAISVTNGQLMATQQWDGANSQLNYIAGDAFMIVALSMPLKFTRDNDKKINQLILNGKDVFTKLKN